MISAAQIRAGRALLNIKQSELAKAAGVSLATLNNIERGIGDPRASTLQALERALELAGVLVEDDGVRETVILVRYDRPNARDTYFASQRALEILSPGSLLNVTNLTVFARLDGPSYMPGIGTRVGFMIKGIGRTLLFDQAEFTSASSPRAAEIAGILLAAHFRLGGEILYIDRVMDDTATLQLEDAVALLSKAPSRKLENLKPFFDIFDDWDANLAVWAEKEGHPLRVLVRRLAAEGEVENEVEELDLFADSEDGLTPDPEDQGPS